MSLCALRVGVGGRSGADGIEVTQNVGIAMGHPPLVVRERARSSAPEESIDKARARRIPSDERRGGRTRAGTGGGWAGDGRGMGGGWAGQRVRAGGRMNSRLKGLAATTSACADADAGEAGSLRRQAWRRDARRRGFSRPLSPDGVDATEEAGGYYSSGAFMSPGRPYMIRLAVRALGLLLRRTAH